MRELAGTAVAKWLNVELPKVQNLRLDLLGETVAGGLIHVELQSSNDLAMPLRMAEYCLGVFRLFGRFPQQVVLYVGEARLTMQKELRGADVLFQYRLIDIRELNGDRLLESEDVGDHVIAKLAGFAGPWKCGTQDCGPDRGPGSGGAGHRAGAVDDPGGIATLVENGRAGGAENAHSSQYSGKRSLETLIQEGYAGSASGRRTDHLAPAD